MVTCTLHRVYFVLWDMESIGVYTSELASHKDHLISMNHG